jgi:hypothetical protein
MFWQKVRVENFPQKFDKIFDVSFSSIFFVLSHFRMCFSDGSSKTLQKTFCKQNRVEKLLQKIRPEVQNYYITKTDFFSTFFNHVFGRFSVRGVQKHDFKKNVEKNLTPVLFWPLTHPPTTGVTDFFFWRPLGHVHAGCRVC